MPSNAVPSKAGVSKCTLVNTIVVDRLGYTQSNINMAQNMTKNEALC